MKDAQLRRLAEAAGLVPEWTDYRNRPQQVSGDTLLRMLGALGIEAATPGERDSSLQRLQDEAASPPPLITATVGEPVPLPWHRGGWFQLELEDGGRIEGRREAGAPLPRVERPGYHRLSLDADEPLTLAVAPTRCFGMQDIGEHRRWGLSAQVYSLRREGDGGIGDFGGVARLARAAAASGADALAISPVHALFAAWPQRHAPYAPSSRLLRNPLLADPAAVFAREDIERAAQDAGGADAAQALESQELMDAGRAAPLKAALLAALHARLERRPDLRAAFEAECAAAPPAWREHACFELLHAHFLRTLDLGDWRRWPASYQDPRSAEVARFAQAHAHELQQQLFMQWLAERSLAHAQRSARESGMAIGLIGDLAVGTDGAGSQAWSRQSQMLRELRIGAPPDELNPLGQDWGLGTFDPCALRREGYAGFIELLRAALRHVGGVRLDHVLGLQRLWLIPPGAGAREGAYLRYPLQDLLRLVALESWRHRAIVIGEDLGTLPPGFQQRLETVGLCGMRVMWFQRDHGLFVDPSRWPASAVAMTSTHDLPTVAGWWAGRDIEWRVRLDLFEPGTDATSLRVDRERDRVALWDAFAHAGVAGGPPPGVEQGGDVARAAAAFIGRTPAQLALLPLEDALALPEQPNIPGTTDEHPNWCRRLPQDVDAAFDAPEVRARLAALDAPRRSPR